MGKVRGKRGKLSKNIRKILHGKSELDLISRNFRKKLQGDTKDEKIKENVQKNKGRGSGRVIYEEIVRNPSTLEKV